MTCLSKTIGKIFKDLKKTQIYINRVDMEQHIQKLYDTAKSIISKEASMKFYKKKSSYTYRQTGHMSD